MGSFHRPPFWVMSLALNEVEDQHVAAKSGENVSDEEYAAETRIDWTSHATSMQLGRAGGPLPHSRRRRIPPWRSYFRAASKRRRVQASDVRAGRRAGVLGRAPETLAPDDKQASRRRVDRARSGQERRSRAGRAVSAALRELQERGRRHARRSLVVRSQSRQSAPEALASLLGSGSPGERAPLDSGAMSRTDARLRSVDERADPANNGPAEMPQGDRDAKANRQ